MKYLYKQTGGLTINPNSSKYFIEKCSPEWVKIEKEIKKSNPRDIDIQKSQVLTGKMMNQDVVVKIGESQYITNEYNSAKIVKQFKGFVKFFCFFTCNDNFREFFEGKRVSICKGPGSSMKVIIMPYFPLGSIASFPWNKENEHVLHSCLYVACLSYIDAYKEKKFIHNDFHSANLLLKATKQTELKFSGDITVPLYGIRPWISDFEQSVIGTGSLKDYEDFRYDVSKLFFLLKTFISSIKTGPNLNIINFLQNSSNICSDESRKQLWKEIQMNIRIM